MKKEEILALVNELEKKINVDPLLAAPIIETLRENLKKDIRLESARASGKLDRVKANDCPNKSGRRSVVTRRKIL